MKDERQKSRAGELIDISQNFWDRVGGEVRGRVKVKIVGMVRDVIRVKREVRGYSWKYLSLALNVDVWLWLCLYFSGI